MNSWRRCRPQTEASAADEFIEGNLRHFKRGGLIRQEDRTKRKVLGLKVRQGDALVFGQCRANCAENFRAGNQARSSVDMNGVRYLEFGGLKSVGHDGGENDGA